MERQYRYEIHPHNSASGVQVYTKKMTDEKVKELISNHIEYSKVLKKQSEKNNIKFYDTSFERDNVLEEAMRYLIN